VARAEVEPMTLLTKGVDSTNAPHTPHVYATISLEDSRYALQKRQSHSATAIYVVCVKRKLWAV